MRQKDATLLQRLSKALRTQYDDVANEPLPERWTDLIHYLNEKERERPQGRESALPFSSRSPGAR